MVIKLLFCLLLPLMWKITKLYTLQVLFEPK